MSVCRSSHCLLRRTPCSIPSSPSRTVLSRFFHQTVIPQDDAPSKIPPVRSRPVEKAIVKPPTRTDAMRQEVRPYTEKELEAFKQYYTPQQIEALEASQNSIDLKDLEEQAIKRNDPFMLRYFDDLSKLDPLLDNKELPEVTHAPKMSFIDKDEFLNRVVDKMRYGGMTIPEMSYAIQQSTLSAKMKAGLKTLNRWKGSHKEDAVKEILWKFVPKADNNGITADGQKTIAALFKEVEQLEMRPIKKAEILALRHWVGTEKENALRPMLERAIANNPKGLPVSQSRSGDDDINKLQDIISEKLGFNLEDDLWLVSGANKETLNDPIYNAAAPDIPTIKDPMARYVDEFDDPNAAAMAKLALQTGLDTRTLNSLSVRVLVRNFVTNQTRMGKIQSIYVLSVAGNGNGWLGIGEGKSEEFEDAYIQSKIRAIRGMKPIRRYEGRTIYGEVNAKVGGTTVQLSSRPPGFGLRTQHLVYEVARICGLRDLSARVGRSRNPMNTVKAMFEALTKQKLPEDIARARGKKLVDVRKVYYGQSVH